jgi:hypothetical protein
MTNLPSVAEAQAHIRAAMHGMGQARRTLTAWEFERWVISNINELGGAVFVGSIGTLLTSAAVHSRLGEDVRTETLPTIAEIDSLGDLFEIVRSATERAYYIGHSDGQMVGKRNASEPATSGENISTLTPYGEWLSRR